MPRVTVVSMEDYRRLQAMDEQDREAWSIVEAMRAPCRDVSPEELERAALRSVAEATARRRAERDAAAEE